MTALWWRRTCSKCVYFVHDSFFNIADTCDSLKGSGLIRIMVAVTSSMNTPANWYLEENKAKDDKTEHYISWYLHKDLLERRTTLLSKLSKKNRSTPTADSKDSEAIVTLWLKTELEIFQSFVKWLYGGKLTESDFCSADEAYSAWVFGDRYGAIGYQNAVMKILVGLYQEAGYQGENKSCRFWPMSPFTVE